MQETPESTIPEFGVQFASTSVHQHVHSASISPLPDGGLIAAWFAGSREGAHDVNIRGSRFDPRTREWGPEFRLISRATTEKMLRRDIRKLGNPVIALAPDDRLWLFYVSVSVGGWAGSAINAMYSDDAGNTWSTPKRLITSPFFNISTLVRNPPVFHEDGSIGLPIYHEFLGKFAEYLYLSPDGEIIDKFRISDGDDSLQPSVVPLDGDSAVAVLRNAGRAHGKVLTSFSNDRGETWSEMAPADAWNPNSAVGAVNEGNNDILVALNDLRDGRFRLSLYHTDSELKNWEPVRVLDESPIPSELVEADLFRQGLEADFMDVAQGDPVEQARLADLVHYVEQRACNDEGNCEFKFEYPTIIRARDGYFHLVYSWNNALIKHVYFNNAWLKELHD
ncbi:sialidase family protein [Gilvimarinus sp. F26214L]|uniref:sialidase family protein n=1 Tax=Gilvimarinus sp. DZF01 TaxID=3461371 RepID=UPI00404559FA